MATRQQVQRVMKEVIAGMPGTIRALARESGIDHSVLVKVRAGKLNLSPAAAAAVIKALRKWSRDCDRLAEKLAEVTERR